MPLTVTCERLASNEPWSSDRNQQRTYETVYRIKQTDTGSRAGVVAMIGAAQALGSNPLPLYGDNWSLDGDTDLDAYALEYSSIWQTPADRPKFLDVTVKFAPVKGGDPGNLAEPDPLLWGTEYWVEWTEEQVVLAEAANVENLPTILRNPGTVGKVVNGCGVEFTEPLMKTVYYPVLHAQRNYQTLDEIVALNIAFQGTTNSDTFFGAEQRKAKYLGTESGRIQKINGESFYVGITRIWFKDATWDRKVLNNGWNHIELADGVPVVDGEGHAVLFKNKVHDDPQTIEDDPDADPDTPCSEPLNLALDGTLIPTGVDPVYISYRDLNEVAYGGLGIGGV